MSFDPHFDKVSVLMNFEGSDESQEFRDLSPLGRTVTAAGAGSAISTDFAKFGTTSFKKAAGNTGGLYFSPRTGVNPQNQFGDEDFTIEMWFKSASAATPGGNMVFMSDWDAGDATDKFQWLLYWENSNQRIHAYANMDGQAFTNTFIAATDLWDTNWHHIGMEKFGGSLKAFKDGAMSSGTVAFGDTPLYEDIPRGWTLGGTPNLGTDIAAFSNYAGYFDDLRITKGVARYDLSAYTVPTEAFPTIPGGMHIRRRRQRYNRR